MSLARLWTVKNLEWVGFWIEAGGVACPSGEGLESEDEMATLMARLALGMVAARSVRAIALLRSWPHGALLMLGTEAQASAALARLKEDQRQFLRIKHLGELGNSRARTLADRAVMGLVCNEQLVCALERASPGDWKVTDSIRAWLGKKEQRIISSLICEDAFNAQKNSNVIKSKRRYMCPQKASVVIIEQKVGVAFVCKIFI